MSESRVPPARFVALDVHTHDVMMAAVDRFDGWSAQQVRPSDAVVLEATTNAWHLVDQLQPLVAAVTVAHPLKVGEIAGARVKTDARATAAAIAAIADSSSTAGSCSAQPGRGLS